MEDNYTSKDVYELNSSKQDIYPQIENGSGDAESEYGPNEKWRIMRNIVVLSGAFMVQFTAFQGAANLQSSINVDAGLGTASLATIYGSLILSNVFLPVVMMKWLGCKWTLCISFMAYMPYIAAQFYPEFYTLIPAALFVGFGGGPLWCAKCTYLTVASEAYSKISGVPADVLVIRYFGIFFMIFQFSQVWGNLISSLVLSSGNTETGPVNITLVQEICGANFHPLSNVTSENSNLEPPSKDKIYTIAGIYLCCMAAACVIIAVGLDSMKRYDAGRKGSGSDLTGLKLLAITLKLLKESKQLLILPIVAFLGISQAFIGADYTASYVSCAWGISNIGYVMICYGVCNSISAIGTGSLVKLTGRVPVVATASVLHLGIIIGLLLWRPSPEHGILYFVVSGLWGVVDGVWLVQINAFCGILFPGREEAAYSNFRLWESLGFIVAYAYSSYVITAVKLYILIVTLAIGMVGYLWTEHKVRQEAQTLNSNSQLYKSK